MTSPDELAELIEATIAGDCQAAERLAVLADGDAQLDQVIRRQLQMASVLRAAAGAPDPALAARVVARIQPPGSRSRRLRRQRPTSTRWLSVVAMAACVAIACLLFLSVPTGTSPLEPWLEDTPGAVLTVAGQPLPAGSPVPSAVVLAATHGHPVLRWHDGTRVSMHPGSSLRLGEAADVTLDLHQGQIAADVAVRTRPFTVATPQGKATVLGTRFTLEVAAEHTRLVVATGAVRLERSDGTESRIYRAGEQGELSIAVTAAPVPAALRVVRHPVADTYAIHAADPLPVDEPFPGRLVVKSVQGQGELTRIAFLRFDLSGLTGRVVEANLHLTVRSVRDGSSRHVLHTVDAAWSEPLVPWNRRPSIVGPQPWVEWPVENVGSVTVPLPVRAIVLGQPNNLQISSRTLVGWISYASREDEEEAARPRLELTLQPEAD